MKILDIYNVVKTKLFKVGKRSSPEWCKECQREKDKAIIEQLEKGSGCASNKCSFKNEIETAIQSKEPELVLFEVNKLEVFINEPIKAKWAVKYSKKCILQGTVVNSVGEVELYLNESSNIILEAESYSGMLFHDNIAIKVFPQPEIISFTIKNTSLILGSSTNVSWQTIGVNQTYLIINGIENTISNNGQLEIYPKIDTIIELKLIGHLNSVLIQTKNVNVHEPAQIKSFTPDKNKILDKENVTFSYDIENASKVYLAGSSLTNKVDISSTNEYKFAPSILNNHSITQVYYLEVYDKIDNLLPRVQINIEVFPQPTISSYTLSKEKILIGDEVEINWNVINFSKLHLQVDENLIEVSNQTSYLFKPKKIAKCKLIVNSLENLKTIESSIQIVQVLNYVEIDFTTDKTHTVQTAPINLKWNVKNATKIYMNEHSNSLSDSGNLVVHPNRTTVYKIFASNELDKLNSELRINVFPLPVIEKFTFPQLPNITPKLQETFTGSVSDNGHQFNTTILPPQNLNKKATNKLFDFVNNRSTISGKSLHSAVISKNIASEHILNLIRKKTNHE